LRATVEGGVTDARLEAVKIEVDDRRSEKSQELTENQPSYDGDAEGTAEFGADAVAESKRKGAQECGHGRH
jgi:hypothetical protein